MQKENKIYERLVKDDNFLYSMQIDYDEDYGRENTSCPKCKQWAWCDRKDRIYLNTLFSIAWCTECGFIRYEPRKLF